MAVLVRFGLPSLPEISSLPNLADHPTALVPDQCDVDHDGARFVSISRIAMVAPCRERRVARWIQRRKTGVIVAIPFLNDVQQCALPADLRMPSSEGSLPLANRHPLVTMGSSS